MVGRMLRECLQPILVWVSPGGLSRSLLALGEEDHGAFRGGRWVSVEH
jgi:hypothetical protein